MNKLKTIGLSALAGTLASVAYAGDVTLSGGLEMTWTNKAEKTGGDGNPIGLKKSLTFDKAGELDNGWTWSANTALVDSGTGDVFGSLTSAGISFTMGDMGTLSLGQSQAGAIGAIDDVMPTAWEETWNGQATAPALVGNDTGGTHIDFDSADLGMGTTLHYTFNPDRGSTLSGGGAAADGAGDAWSIALKTSAGVDGLSLGVGYSEMDRDITTKDRGASGNASGSYEHEHWEGTWYAKYAIGPVTIGYQKTGEDDGNIKPAGVDYYEAENWGVSMLVNDNLSISFANYESTKHLNAQDATADVTLDIDAINISYTMGAMSIRYQDGEASNSAYSTGSSYDHQELNISLAF